MLFYFSSQFSLRMSFRVSETNVESQYFVATLRKKNRWRCHATMWLCMTQNYIPFFVDFLRMSFRTLLCALQSNEIPRNVFNVALNDTTRCGISLFVSIAYYFFNRNFLSGTLKKYTFAVIQSHFVALPKATRYLRCFATLYDKMTWNLGVKRRTAKYPFLRKQKISLCLQANKISFNCLALHNKKANN